MGVNEVGEYYNKITNFFEEIRKKDLKIETKQDLYDLIMGLENRTDNQKRRFILYYNLEPQPNSKCMTYAAIARLDGCTANAIPQSVFKVMCSIRRLKDERKDLLLKIIAENDYEKI